MTSSKGEKTELRKQYSMLRDRITGEDKKQKDRKILRRLTSLASYRYASLVLFYSPIRSEVDVWPAIEEALFRGKKVALPLCEKASGIMTFRYISGKKDLSPGAFGVLEPAENAPKVQKKDLLKKSTLMVIPALAFDREGYRLGYGKGYYDRYLNGFAGVTVGLCYQSLFFDSLPRGYFDKKVELVVTEQGVKMTG